jgi:hypothetical protein
VGEKEEGDYEVDVEDELPPDDELLPEEELPELPDPDPLLAAGLLSDFFSDEDDDDDEPEPESELELEPEPDPEPESDDELDGRSELLLVERESLR